MANMQTHRVLDDDEPERTIAMVHPAKPEYVRLVLDADESSADGRSPWMWVRLPNGDLILGVYPQGDTYLACEADSFFPD